MDATCVVRQVINDDQQPLRFPSTLGVGSVCVIPDLSEQLRPSEPGGPGHLWSSLQLKISPASAAQEFFPP